MIWSPGALGLLFLESTFLFTAFALFFHQRENIGKAAFSMAMTVVTVLTFFAIGADIQCKLIGDLYFSVPKTVMFPPLLAAYLLVFIAEGTLSAQRFIYGLTGIYALLFYLGVMLKLQCSWADFSLSAGVSGPALDMLLNSNRAAMNSSALRVIFDLFYLPIVYSKLTELRLDRGIAILLAMVSAPFAHVLPDWMIQLGAGGTPEWITGDLIARIGINFWMGILLASYLRMGGAEKPASGRSLDLFFAFFGSYGRSKALEKNLQEWQNRYQIILRNAAETILLFNAEFEVTDANDSARRMFGSAAKTGSSAFLEKLTDFDPPEFSPMKPGTLPKSFYCTWKEGPRGPVRLFGSLAPVALMEGVMIVFIGRDITEEMKLTEEKRKLAEQLAHSQRLESLGILAGGVAHDFNNYIHAILGHVDVARMRGQIAGKWDDGIEDHLNKVIAMAEKAGELTRQLLGFARRGNYVESDFDPAVPLKASIGLLGPKKLENVQLNTEIPEGKFLIHCDQLQFQQVIMNIVINALYATEKNEGSRSLSMKLERGSARPDFRVPPDREAKAEASDFAAISITDNGCGMDEATKVKIFEPFFTTKPVGVGTGMGLSMAYGIITKCGGWIQVDSAPGKGSTFTIFVPEVLKKGA